MSAQPFVLALDASTYAGSAAVLRGSEVMGECTVAMRGEREERLMPAIGNMLADAGVRRETLDAVVCGAGPGSFTSLRIAASIAKGLAVSLDVSFYAVPSLLLVTAGAAPAPASGRYAVVMDAMRGEVYAVVSELAADRPPRLVSPIDIIPAAEAEGFARARGAALIGPAVGAGVSPHARGVARLWTGEGWADSVVAADLDQWEPDYGRLAEAQVRWEASHGRALSNG